MSSTAKLADITVTVSSTAGGSEREFVVGTTIGKYEVRRIVGAGGAGVVLAAYDAELGRSVAIKFLVRESEEARARLMREAQAMAKLSHPNVVTVYEVLRVDERIAIVMELVAGRTLGDWQAEPRAWREIVGAYVQAARGLAAAHRAGLVHRDFKPANALIDADSVVRVTDFGLVRTADDRTAGAAVGGETANDELTQTGVALGTPAYMAPEQHAAGVVDAKTDQWALACSLYGALYGQRPFAGDKPSEIRAAVLAGVPRHEPDTRVPKSIRAAIRRALANDPVERFSAIDDFIAAITPRRRAWIAAATAAGAGALAAGGIAVATAGGATETCKGLEEPMRHAWNPLRGAVVSERFAAAGLRTGERTVAALDRYGSDWADARVRTCQANRRGELSAELFDRKMSCLDQRLAEVDALTSALVLADRSTIDQATTAVGGLHPVSDCDDPRDTIPRPADPVTRAEIDRGEQAFARAWAMGELNQFIEAKPIAQQAVQIAERTGWQPLVARAQVQLGQSLSHEHDGVGAIAAFDRAATAAAKARDDTTLARALAAKVFELAVTLGKPDDALAMKPYVELALERAGRPPRARAEWLHDLAQAHFAKHEWDLAEGDLARARGDWSRARTAYARAIEVANQGDDTSPAATTLGIIGVAESDLALGKAEDAVRALDERLAWLALMHADPGAMAAARLVLARALVASGGDRTRAKTLAEAARDAFAASNRTEAGDAVRWIASTFGK